MFASGGHPDFTVRKKVLEFVPPPSKRRLNGAINV